MTSASRAGTPTSVPRRRAGRSRISASTNGVLVNGQSVRGTQALHPGDRIELGSTEIIFELG